MFIITAKDDYGTETRFVIGCVGPVEPTVRGLHNNGYDVRVTEGEIPQRSKEEVERAQRVLEQLFGE